jgi:metal-dependent amidase/aminoacylase/carboxypeptidase family protein
MKTTLLKVFLLGGLAVFLTFRCSAAQTAQQVRETVRDRIEKEYPALFELYKHLHAHPELSSQEVRLQLTARSYSDEVRHQTIESIKRIARGQAIAAGLPENLLPEVSMADDSAPALHNDPELTERLARVFKAWLGEANALKRKPAMGAEDFSEFGRVDPKIPICMFWIGGVSREAYEESERTGKPLPSLHSPFWAPVPEPTIKTGVTAMTAAVLDLMQKAD